MVASQKKQSAFSVGLKKCQLLIRSNKLAVLCNKILSVFVAIGILSGYSIAQAQGTVTLPCVSYPSAVSFTYNNPITTPLKSTNTCGAVPATTYATVSTLAGGNGGGSANGAGAIATFYNPQGIATDVQGNVYVADMINNQIRKITPAGVVSTLAGSGAAGSTDGMGSGASFSSPMGVTVDAAGNVYAADSRNNLIRKITPAGVVSTFAGNINAVGGDGTGLNAAFYSPQGLAIDKQGNIYVADAGHNLIRKITPGAVVTTIASGFNYPTGVTVDAAGNIYVAESGNNDIKKITSAGVVSIFAGSGTAGAVNGTGTAASFNKPNGVSTDAQGNVYVADAGNNLIRMITPTGVVSTLAGAGLQNYVNGIGSAAMFNSPNGVATDGLGNLYVADANNNAIRKIIITGYNISPALPTGLIFDSTTGTISGTPTVLNTAPNYTITGYNVAGGSSAALKITITGTPVINSFIPTNAGTATTVNIYGLGFTGATSVQFGGAQAQSFKVISDNQISAVVGTGASGLVSVTLPGAGGTASLAGFTYLAAPVISYTTPQNFTISTPIGNVTPSNAGGPIPATTYTQVSTLAGGNGAGSLNGAGTTATFNGPQGVALDAQGNVYVADMVNNQIRKITPAGVVSTLAGSGAAGSANGTGGTASFSSPIGVTADASGNVYVADYRNNLIRKITPAGVVSTFAGNVNAVGGDGVGINAAFYGPQGLAIDGQGNIYVADAGINAIRKITPAAVVTTIATGFNYPTGVAVDPSGTIYVADNANNQIKKITPAGVVSVFAGSGTAGSANGTGTAASFKNPNGVSTDAQGNVYVADAGNFLIRMITPAGVVTTLAGSGVKGYVNGIGTSAVFSTPNSIATDGSGNLYIADFDAQAIRKIALTGYTISAALPSGLSFNGTTGNISGTPKALTGVSNYTITGYNAAGSSTTTLSIAVNGATCISYPSAVSYPYNTTITPLKPGNNCGLVPATTYGQVSTLAGGNGVGSANGAGTIATFYNPPGIATDAQGNVYVADMINNQIRKITPAGVVSTLAGSGAAGSTDGMGSGASFSSPMGVTVDAAGNVYAADSRNNLIRKITPAGVVSTFAGNINAVGGDGTGLNAAFYSPQGLAIDKQGNIYVADAGHNLIRKITPGAVVTTIASGFNYPTGVTVDAAGNIYVAESGNNDIKKITSAGVVSIFAGSGTAGAVNGTGTAASFNKPNGVSTDAQGNVYVADAGNNLIRMITPTGVVSTLAGAGLQNYVNGIGSAAMFNSPNGVATDGLGNLYVADANNNAIRKIIITGYNISPALPTGLIFDSTTGTISGTPTVLNTAPNYTITGYNVAGGSSAALKITITGTPVINSFIPTNAGTATTVNIYGLGFTGATSVQFGGAQAQSFKVISDNQISAVVGTGASGLVSVTLPGAGGTASLAGFTYLAAPVISYTTPQNFTISTPIGNVTPSNAGGPIPATTYTQVSTLAGGNGAGSLNGAGTTATFNGPQGVALDAQGNVYVADMVNNQIRKITPAGVVSTLAGSGAAGSANGTGGTASFSSPIGVTADASGNVYVADYRNNLIRKITPAGVVSTFAGNVNAVGGDGVGINAAFYGPQGLAIDGQGNIYVADAGINAIRKITPAAVVTTIATGFNYPTGVAVDPSGTIYVADNANNQIKKITPAGVVSVFAGSGTAGSANGTGTAASFKNPNGVSTDAQGNVYVADAGNFLIRMITPAGVVTTLAGSGTQNYANGVGTAASFSTSNGVATDNMGNLYVIDGGNNSVRKILLTGYTIKPTLLAGLSFDGTTGIISGTPTAISSASNYIITGYNIAGSSSATVSIAVQGKITPPIISYLTPQTYTINTAISTLLPTNTGGAVPNTSPSGLVSTFAGSGNAGYGDGTGTGASFSFPVGIAIDGLGNFYVADSYNNRIRKITALGVVSTFAGGGYGPKTNGTGTAASFNNPTGVATDAAGNAYVADKGNNLIRKITPLGEVSTYAGSSAQGNTNGTGTAASFNAPSGVATDAAGNVYVADQGNQIIRKITPLGVVTTLAGSGNAGFADGTGTAASFRFPTGLATDAAGNVYVADQSNQLIRKITPDGVVTTLAGNGAIGLGDGVGNLASFNNPFGLCTDVTGNVFVADAENNSIRKITPSGVVSTIAGSGTAGLANGVGSAAMFNDPTGVVADGAGNLYVVEYRGNLIRKISLSGYNISPSLPAGLNFDGTTGIISGTPSAASLASNYTVTAYNAAGSSITTLNITVSGFNSFSPATATTGTLVSILGAGLTGATGVSFGGTPAQSFNVVSDGQINAIVGAGNNGSISVTTPAGTFSLPGFIFLLPPLISYSGSQAYTINTTINSLQPTNKGGVVPNISPSGLVSTFAGNGIQGSTNGISTSASFYNPLSVAMDGKGNIYIDDNTNVIRKTTPIGLVSSFAGGDNSFQVVNGTGIAASFGQANNVATDLAGNIYVADYGFNLIRKITPAGVVSTFAGNGSSGSTNGIGTAASFNRPTNIATDAVGNIYVADYGNRLIRKITPLGVVSTLAGNGNGTSVDGLGTAASFYNPTGIATDAAGNVYVAETYFIRKITPTGVVTTIAGNYKSSPKDGIGASASFNNPTNLCTDFAGNVYVADAGNNLIRKITPAGVVSTIAGSGFKGSASGVGISATFNAPSGICTDGIGNLYVADLKNYLIRKISLSGYSISPTLPAGLNFDGTTGIISGTPTVASSATNYTITAYNTVGSNITTVSIKVSGINSFSPVTAAPGTLVAILGAGFSGVTAVSFGGTPAQSFNIVSDGQINAIVASGASGSISVTSPAGTFSLPGFTFLPAPSISYTGSQTYTINTAINSLAPINTGGAVPNTSPSGLVSTFAGSGLNGNTNGAGTAASFYNPMGVTTDGAGNVYVADEGNNLIRKITPAGVVSTFAGSGSAGFVDGPGVLASFNTPKGIATDLLGNIYVADTYNNAIRKITPDGVVTTLAESGLQGYYDGVDILANFKNPSAIATDAASNVYVADTFNHLIRKITPAGVITTLAGNGYQGSNDGTGTSASLNFPYGLTTDIAGNIYVGDLSNNKIRKITPLGVTSTFAGSGEPDLLDGVGAAANFHWPCGLATDVAGNFYVVDQLNNAIRKITPSAVVSTIAGSGKTGSANGVGYAASFNYPYGIASDGVGNLYVGDQINNLIRKISLTGYNISPALPAGLSFDGTTGIISGTPKAASPPTTYTVTAYNVSGSSITTVNISVGGINSISPATATTGTLVTIVGAGFTGATAVSFGGIPAQSFKIISDGQINAIVGAGGSGAINVTTPIGTFSLSGFTFLLPPLISYPGSQTYTINTAITNFQPTNAGGIVPNTSPSGLVSTFAGSGLAGNTNGAGIAASFSSPASITMDLAGNFFVADRDNNLIRKITAVGIVSTFAGNGYKSYADGSVTGASFSGPNGVAADAIGNVYVGDTFNSYIRKIIPSGVVITMPVSFGTSYGLAIDPVGNVYFGAYNVIWKITPAGVISNFAGSGGQGSTNGTSTVASFNAPTGVATDALGNVYVADYGNNLIRKITPDGLVSTLAGNGLPGYLDGVGILASFKSPTNLTTDAAGNVYVADYGNNLIRKITPSGVVSTIAGSGTLSSVNGIGTSASFNNPRGIISDGVGNLYVADQGNNLIRKIGMIGYSISPTLPAGLSFDGKTGTISGIPTAISPAATYTITGYNAVGSSITTVSIAVGPATATKTAALLADFTGTPQTMVPYPMPFTNTLNINIGETPINNLIVKIFDTRTGNQVYFKEFTNQVGVLALDASNLNKGVYSLHLVYNNQHKIYKVFK